MFKKSVQFKLYQVTSKLNSVSRSSVKGWDEFRSGLQVGPSSDRACRSDRVQVGLAGRTEFRSGLQVGPSAGRACKSGLQVGRAETPIEWA